ncbi:MAG TPA: hypothetical protein VJQ25_07165 [Nitrospira sp.]|nr:hypothetical protein [Nitrospira sp.]
MINLRWAPFPGSNVAEYKVYRSIIGFSAPVVTPATLAGKTLVLKINGGNSQTITFSGTSPVIDQINAQLTGGKAFPSAASSTKFILRSNLRVAPGSVQIVSGTALADLQLTARTIVEKSEDFLIATVPALEDPEQMVDWADPDGCPEDFYAIATVDSLANESTKTSFRQATAYTGAICVLEGIITDLQGVRYPDAHITIELTKYPQAIGKVPQITRGRLHFRSGPDGRFSIPVLQGALILFEIKEVQFSRPIEVPSLPYMFLTDIKVDLDYRYPLEYRE